MKLLFEESYFKQSLPYLVQIQLLSHHVLSNPFGEVGYPGVSWLLQPSTTVRSLSRRGGHQSHPTTSQELNLPFHSPTNVCVKMYYICTRYYIYTQYCTYIASTSVSILHTDMPVIDVTITPGSFTS